MPSRAATRQSGWRHAAAPWTECSRDKRRRRRDSLPDRRARPRVRDRRRETRQHEARPELATLLVVDRLHPRARDAEDRDFRRVDDRREVGAADAAEVGDAEAAALHLLERDLAVARLLGELLQLHRELDDVLL